MNLLALLIQHEVIRKEWSRFRQTGIFGLFVRGEERPESDVDVLVTFRKDEETFDHYMNCKFYLEDLLWQKVDLVIEDTM